MVVYEPMAWASRRFDPGWSYHFAPSLHSGASRCKHHYFRTIFSYDFSAKCPQSSDEIRVWDCYSDYGIISICITAIF